MNSVIDILWLGGEIGGVQVTNITMRLRALDKHGRVGTCNRPELTVQDETLLLVARCEADTGETQRRIAAGSLSLINGLLPATGYSRKGERGFLAALASSRIVLWCRCSGEGRAPRPAPPSNRPRCSWANPTRSR
jgi:hypothetical protein